MSLPRTIGQMLGMIVFSTMLSFSIFSIGFINFTEYENMKAVFSEILSPQIEQSFGSQDISTEDMLSSILELCEGKDRIEVSITEGGNKISVNCNQVRAIESQEGEKFKELVSEMAVSAIFEEIYYQDYECEFVECIQNSEMGVLFSPKGNEFFISIQKYLYIGTVIGLAVILVSAETWTSRLKCTGISMLSVGLIYFILTYVKTMLTSGISPDIQAGIEQAGISLSPIIDRVFAPMMNNLLYVFVVGTLMTIASFAWEHYKKKERSPSKKPANN